MKKPLETLSWQKFNSKASGRNTGTPLFKGSREALAGASVQRTLKDALVSPVPLNRFPFLESRLVKRAGLGDGWPEFQFFILFYARFWHRGLNISKLY
jgi:hypothetical protein